MKQSTLKRIDKGSQSMIEGSIFLLTMIAMVTAVYIYQMISIGTGWEEMVSNGEGIILDWLPNGGFQEMSLELIRQTVQSMGSISILIGITLIARGKKAGWLYNVIGNAFIFTNGFMTGLWFETGTRAAMFTLYLITLLRYDKQSKESAGDIERGTWKNWAIALGILGVGLAITGIIVGTGSTDVIGMKTPWADTIQGMLNISAVYLLGRRKTEGQLAFVVSNIFALIMFMIVGQWVMLFSTLAFELVSFVAWLQWEAIRAERTQDNYLYVIPVNK